MFNEVNIKFKNVRVKNFESSMYSYLFSFVTDTIVSFCCRPSRNGIEIGSVSVYTHIHTPEKNES